MKQKVWLVIVVILQFACSSHTASAQTDADKINELLTTYVRLYKFNGTVLVVNKGQVVFSKGYGFKSVKDSTYNDVNTIYQLGSVTKQFTATIILQLQEQKKLSVQDKLSKYFPGLPGADTITIEHLLTHTSGIFNYTNDGKFMSSEAVKPATSEKIIALFKDKPLDFEPGTKWNYSNSGYMLLGYIIEKVAGKPYEQVVRERIFNPLGMTHSGFDFAHLADLNKATGYTMYTEKAKITAGIVDSSVSYAAGAIYSTVNDLWQWHKGLMKNTVLKPASLEKAYTPFKNNYGYGWFIDTVSGKRVVQHGGGIFGFNTNLARIPSDDACVVLLCNMNTSTLDNINKAILSILNNRPYELPKERKVITVDTAVLQQYVGEYELAPTFKLVVWLKNGNLVAQATGQQEVELFAESPAKFFLKVVDAQLEFVKGAEGKVEKVILYQNGRETAGKKIK
ncbi:serine hydrolase [Pseudoflavitalea sp. X16]|uniref:serine hydrolase n=1 Tax=Paraflavitalea devenefica TaxID=2716334 RepID=UPI0014239E5A|nr:serine hydrolase [Paraflavitalea devenefica]NII28152.1 serine hydrolase [Paraflavitalea devenefica]